MIALFFQNKSVIRNLSSKMPPKSKKHPQVVANSKPVPEISVPDIEESFSSWEPENWKVVMENIRKMRAELKAPVDTAGCHKCQDKEADKKTQRYQILVSLMLSSQTKDDTTFAAIQRLIGTDTGLTPSSIVAMNVNVLQDLLKPVSFYKVKAKHIQQTGRILIDKYNSDIPNNVKDLVALPGVGPKMAHICMSAAWNEVTGIGVDVHVHRIANRLRWVQKATKEPEKTRIALEEWLPRDLWPEVNHLLVGFGQTVCTPLRPNCNTCLNRDICPSAFAEPNPRKGRKKASEPTESAENNEESVISIIKKSKFQKKKMQI